MDKQLKWKDLKHLKHLIHCLLSMASFTITVYLFCVESLYDDCETTSHKQHDHGMSRNTSIILNIMNRFQQEGRGLVNACAFYSFFWEG